MAPADPSDNLYIAGLPAEITDEGVRQVLGQYGPIIQCKVLPSIGKPDRVALLRVSTVAQAVWLVDNLNQNIPMGLATPITVQFAQNKAQKAKDVAVGGTAGTALPAPATAAALMPTIASGTTPAAAPAGLQEGVLLTGKVKVWHENRGFGFILPDGGGPDVFVHVRELADGQVLIHGATVMFEVQLDPANGRYRAKTCMGAVQSPTAVAGLGGSAPTLSPNRTTDLAVSDNLFVAGLPPDTTEENIKQIFSQYGIVTSCKVLTSDRPDRACLVRMGSVEQATWLVEHVNNNIPIGLSQPVQVRYAENKAQKSKELRELQAYATQDGGFGKVLDIVLASRRESPYGASGAAVPALPPAPAPVQPGAVELAGAATPGFGEVASAGGYATMSSMGQLPQVDMHYQAYGDLQALQDLQAAAAQVTWGGPCSAVGSSGCGSCGTCGGAGDAAPRAAPAELGAAAQVPSHRDTGPGVSPGAAIVGCCGDSASLAALGGAAGLEMPAPRGSVLEPTLGAVAAALAPMELAQMWSSNPMATGPADASLAVAPVPVAPPPAPVLDRMLDTVGGACAGASLPVAGLVAAVAGVS